MPLCRGLSAQVSIHPDFHSELTGVASDYDNCVGRSRFTTGCVRNDRICVICGWVEIVKSALCWRCCKSQNFAWVLGMDCKHSSRTLVRQTHRKDFIIGIDSRFWQLIDSIALNDSIWCARRCPTEGSSCWGNTHHSWYPDSRWSCDLEVKNMQLPQIKTQTGFECGDRRKVALIGSESSVFLNTKEVLSCRCEPRYTCWKYTLTKVLMQNGRAPSQLFI